MRNKLLGILIGLALVGGFAAGQDWYVASGKPVQRSLLNSADFRTEFASIESDIADKLPPLSGNGGKLIAVNTAGTALETLTGGLAVASGGTGSTTAAGAATNLGLGTTNSPSFAGLTTTGAVSITGAVTLVGDVGVTGAIDVSGDADVAGNIELGHDTDTTLARDSAGVISVEGNTVWTDNNLDYETGTITVNWADACTTTPSETWRYVKIGKQVTLSIDGDPVNGCTSDSTSFATTDAPLPASIRPSLDSRFAVVPVVNNGTVEIGCIEVTNSGNLSAWRNAFGGMCVNGWTATGNKEVGSATIVYALD